MPAQLSERELIHVADVLLIAPDGAGVPERSYAVHAVNANLFGTALDHLEVTLKDVE